MSHRSIFVVLGLFVLGCSGNDSGDSTAPAHDAYESVIRNQVENVRVPADRQLVVYLSLDHEQPPAAFLGRFRDAAFRVEPAKAHRKGDREVFAVFMSLSVGEWQGSDRVRLMAFIHDETEQPTCGTPWPVIVVRRDGRWIVER